MEGAREAVYGCGEGQVGVGKGRRHHVRRVSRDVAALVVGVDGLVQAHHLLRAREGQGEVPFVAWASLARGSGVGNRPHAPGGWRGSRSGTDAPLTLASGAGNPIICASPPAQSLPGSRSMRFPR